MVDAVISGGNVTVNEWDAVPLESWYLVPDQSVAYDAICLVLKAGVSSVGLLTNLLCSFVIVKSHLVRRATTYTMILNFSLANALYCACHLTVGIASTIMKRPVTNKAGSIVFIITKHTTLYVALSCIFISALSSFLSIVLNKTMALFKARLVPVLVALIWTVATILSIIVTSLAEIISIYWPGHITSAFNVSTAQGQGIMGLSMGLIFLPLLSSFLLYLAIYIKVRSSSRRVNTTNTQQMNLAVKEKKTAVRLFCICVTFCVMYLPFATFLGMGPAFPATLRKEIFIATLYWYNIMIALNPFLYGLLFTQIKEAFYSIILRKNNSSDSVAT